MREDVKDHNAAMRGLEDLHAEALSEASNREVSCRQYREQIRELQQELEIARATCSRERNHTANASQLLDESLQRRERAVQHHKNMALMSDHNAAHLEAELEAARAKITNLEQENAETRHAMEMGSLSILGKKAAWRNSGKKWR